MSKTTEPIIVEQILHTTINDAWKAITELDQMKQWYFTNIEDFTPTVGFKTKFKIQVGDRTFTHIWTVTEVIPNQKITYNWKFAEYPGDSFVTFELKEENGQVKIKLLAKVTVSFPDDIPEFRRESGVEGWNYFIRKNLKEYLEAKV